MDNYGELLAAMDRRIECPVSWCDGIYLDHGGDGAPPETWAHASRDEIPLLSGAFVTRWREGTGPDVWTLIRDGAAVIESTSRREIAATLRAWAVAVEQLT